MRLTVATFGFITLLFSSFVSADITQIDNEALEKLQSEGVAIIDVRRLDEWEDTGLVDGSHPITFFDERGRYDAKVWLQQLDLVVKPDQPVVLICAHGVRSAKIAAFLDKRLGYSDVRNVTKGISAWLAEKRPVVAYKAK